MSYQVSVGNIVSLFALLLSVAAIVGTAYVVRYRVERLEDDLKNLAAATDKKFDALVTELHELTGSMNKVASALDVIAAKEQAYDHEERILALEAEWRRCGDCVNFQKAQQQIPR